MTFMKISKLLAALIVTALGSIAQATTYNYSYTLTQRGNADVQVTGSFEGTASGSNLVTNLSHITAFIDGVAFHGNGSLYSGHIDTSADWQSGGAIASFNGLENNFFFSDVPWPNFTVGANFLWAIPIEGAHPFQHVKLVRTNPRLSRENSNPTWTLTAAVPEPETYAMLLAGLGVMGAVARRRKAKQA